jgi:hypothetical protein
MKISRRSLWLLGAICLSAIVLLTLISAPASNKINSGSTYGRSPDGYGAWYAFMAERGTSIERWQKPFSDLANQSNNQAITLLRVNYSLSAPTIDSEAQKWLKKGHNLIVLGVFQPVTEAAFSSTLSSAKGEIKIDTGRRKKDSQEILLGDRFGAVVWQETVGKGRIIYSTTPHLAANAYQDFPGNYEFLAQLVTQKGSAVLVDEYMHGYKDAETIEREIGSNLFSYLAKTPLFPALLQVLILSIVAFLAGLRRFGRPVTVTTPTTENSEAYINALSGVLHKAGSTDFVVEVIGKEERLKLQRALGLGETLLDPQSLIDEWTSRAGDSGKELQQLLQIQSCKNRSSNLELLNWLNKWRDLAAKIETETK